MNLCFAKAPCTSPQPTARQWRSEKKIVHVRIITKKNKPWQFVCVCNRRSVGRQPAKRNIKCGCRAMCRYRQIFPLPARSLVPRAPTPAWRKYDFTPIKPYFYSIQEFEYAWRSSRVPRRTCGGCLYIISKFKQSQYGGCALIFSLAV